MKENTYIGKTVENIVPVVTIFWKLENMGGGEYIVFDRKSNMSFHWILTNSIILMSPYNLFVRILRDFWPNKILFSKKKFFSFLSKINFFFGQKQGKNLTKKNPLSYKTTPNHTTGPYPPPPKNTLFFGGGGGKIIKCLLTGPTLNMKVHVKTQRKVMS